MTYSKTKIEIVINEYNINWFKTYRNDGFNYIFPSGNVELSNYWKYLIGYYYYSKVNNEFVMYNYPVFKTFPAHGIERGEIYRHIITDKLIFEFPDDYPEDELFYFQLKFC